jgi:hypothetical protein
MAAALTEDEQRALSRDFMYLRDKAIIESSTEEKRKVMRSVKKQVELLCCNLPFAYSQVNASLEPYKAEIFPEGRPSTLALNGMACSGDVKRTTKEVLSNVVRSKNKGPFASTDGLYRKFTDKGGYWSECGKGGRYGAQWADRRWWETRGLDVV